LPLPPLAIECDRIQPLTAAIPASREALSPPPPVEVVASADDDAALADVAVPSTGAVCRLENEEVTGAARVEEDRDDDDDDAEGILLGRLRLVLLDISRGRCCKWRK